MEKLVKGLINVAIDAIDGHGNEERRRNEASAEEEEEDERSRATWAEVVSSKSDEKRTEAPAGATYQRPSTWAKKEESEAHQQPPRRHNQEESEGRRNEQQPPRRQQQDGDWETVGDKKLHRPVSHGRPKSEAWQGYKQHPSQQNFSQETNHGSSIDPSREELQDLSKACDRLWNLDQNRLVPGKDYEINLGEGKKVYQKGDVASETLFTWLADPVLEKPTFSRFIALLDNYNPNEGYKEQVTQEDKHEQVAFIEEISRTTVVKYVYKYLVAKQILNCHYEEFKRVMSRLWFDLYGRGGSGGSSSAFEHVFVGEIKNRGENEVSGFHNWIQFYLEEAKGTVDYQGYIFPRRRGEVPDAETQVLTIQFEWHGILKSVSSSLIGVSPEFEIALYTLCYYVGREDNEVNLGPYCVNIKCYRFGRDKIGSVFPIVEN
ncbi:hypothetical protein LUZ60_016909 [Juncus effusus]|nr:hypothetical protein LUZ60_016909 [Juncus effusus]